MTKETMITMIDKQIEYINHYIDLYGITPADEDLLTILEQYKKDLKGDAENV